MILIAHRGNIFGPQPNLENNPLYLDNALSEGYHVEIDVWCKDNEIFLGHDEPQYKTSIKYLKNDKFWCHCKDVESLRCLLDNNIHCFYHEEDHATLTSKGYIWTFPNKKLAKGAVCVMPEQGINGSLENCSGVCSDYIGIYRI